VGDRLGAVSWSADEAACVCTVCAYVGVQVVAFEKFAELLHLAPPTVIVTSMMRLRGSAAVAQQLQLAASTDGGLSGDGLTGLMAGLQQAVGLWQSVVSAFATKTSNNIVQRYEGKGFSHFLQTGQLDETVGLNNEHLEDFITDLRGRLKLPEDWQADFAEQVKAIQWGVETKVWIANTFLFNMGTGGKTKYAALLYHNDDKANKSDLLVSESGTGGPGRLARCACEAPGELTRAHVLRRTSGVHGGCGTRAAGRHVRVAQGEEHPGGHLQLLEGQGQVQAAGPDAGGSRHALRFLQHRELQALRRCCGAPCTAPAAGAGDDGVRGPLLISEMYVRVAEPALSSLTCPAARLLAGRVRVCRAKNSYPFLAPADKPG
jgi:hypothetical protein